MRAATIESLLDELKSKKLDSRQSALFAIIRYGELAIKPLFQVMRDAELRGSVVGILKNSKEEGIIDFFALSLKSDDPSIRLDAIEIMQEIGDSRVIELMMWTLRNDKGGGVRLRAAQALGELGDRRAIEALSLALNDENKLVRREAAKSLVLLGGGTTESLIEALSTEDEALKITIIEAFGEARDERAIQLLVDMSKTGSIAIQTGAIEALGKVGGLATDKLLLNMDSEKPGIRAKTAKALGATGDGRVVEPLIRTLENDQESMVRSSAAEALGQVRDTRAVSPLLQALKTNDDQLRLYAIQALGKIGAREAVESLTQELRESPIAEIRRNAAKALGMIGDKSAIEPLILSLSDPNPAVRLDAVEALERIQDPRIIEPLIRALKDNDAKVQAKAAEILKRSGNKQAEPFLQNYSKEESEKTTRNMLERHIKNIEGKEPSILRDPCNDGYNIDFSINVGGDIDFINFLHNGTVEHRTIAFNPRAEFPDIRDFQKYVRERSAKVYQELFKIEEFRETRINSITITAKHETEIYRTQLSAEDMKAINWKQCTTLEVQKNWKVVLDRIPQFWGGLTSSSTSSQGNSAPSGQDYVRSIAHARLVSNASEALRLVLAGEECALLIWLREYKDVTEKMVQIFAKQQIPFSFPLLICHRCFLDLSLSPSFMMGLTGLDKRAGVDAKVMVMGEDRREYGRRGRCFKCGSDKAFMVFTKASTQSL